MPLVVVAVDTWVFLLVARPKRRGFGGALEDVVKREEQDRKSRRQRCHCYGVERELSVGRNKAKWMIGNHNSLCLICLSLGSFISTLIGWPAAQAAFRLFHI